MNKTMIALVSITLMACIARDDVGHNEAPYKVGPIPVGTIPGAMAVFQAEEYGTLGVANAIVGDLDGDGLDDFVMVDRDQGEGGSTYLFYGRASFEAATSVLQADAVFEGGWEFVAGVGDLNADGLDEFAFVGTKARVGHLVYGSADRLSGRHEAASVSSTIAPAAAVAPEIFGVKRAGDVNGDGFDDLLVELRDGAAISVFLIHGGPDRLPPDYSLAEADATFTGAHKGYNLFLGSATAGDVNGDGFAELLLTTYDSDGRPRIGLYYGGSTSLSGSMSPADADANFDMPSLWMTIGTLGDLDGDGLDDFAVAHEDRIPTFYGKQAKYSGTITIDDSPFSLSPEGGLSNSNLAGLAAGDVDGDGNIDLLVGDPHQDKNGVQTGALYLVLGAPHRFGVQHQLGEDNALMYGENLQTTELGLGEDLGYGVASGGDINGDGYDDVLVGAPGDTVGDAFGGTVYLMYGGARTKHGNPDLPES